MLPAKKNKSDKPSLLERTKARFKAREHTRAIERQVPRYTTHRCAKTGEDYLREWRKPSLDGLYQHTRTITDLTEMSCEKKGGSLLARAQKEGDFDIAEFEAMDPTCALCGDSRLLFHCHHGRIVCGARTSFASNGKPLIFKCSVECRTSSPVDSTVTRVAGSEGQAGGRKKLGGPGKKALPSAAKLIGKG